jgi:hypothetical protein
MSHLFWLDEEHLKRIGHMFPKPRGVKRADVPITRVGRRSSPKTKSVPMTASPIAMPNPVI